VSPAVVVPMMIIVEEKGLGKEKQIPGIIMAACCIDNIVSITGYSLIIGIIFNKGKTSIHNLN
jgi:solute carrier family 9B (sodium/hydrogen exchanger), member 1/2